MLGMDSLSVLFAAAQSPQNAATTRALERRGPSVEGPARKNDGHLSPLPGVTFSQL